MMNIDELRKLSPRQLRLLDIKEVEDETLVQQALNEKIEANPGLVEVNRSDAPDIKTPEEEAAYQKKLDERQARNKARHLASVNSSKDDNSPSGDVNPPGEVTTVAEPKVAPANPSMPGNGSGTQDHVVTQEDLDNNPEMVEQGIKVGEIVGIPMVEDEGKPAEDNPDLEKMNKSELVKYAKSIDLEFGEDVHNNGDRIKAIQKHLAK